VYAADDVVTLARGRFRFQFLSSISFTYHGFWVEYLFMNIIYLHLGDMLECIFLLTYEKGEHIGALAFVWEQKRVAFHWLETLLLFLEGFRLSRSSMFILS